MESPGGLAVVRYFDDIFGRRPLAAFAFGAEPFDFEAEPLTAEPLAIVRAVVVGIFLATAFLLAGVFAPTRLTVRPGSEASLMRRSASNSCTRSAVTVSGSSPRRYEAFVVPSVT